MYFETIVRNIMQNSFREGNAEKVKLWNSILTQVLPINNELTTPEQIQELCTNLYNGNLQSFDGLHQLVTRVFCVFYEDLIQLEIFGHLCVCF